MDLTRKPGLPRHGLPCQAGQVEDFALVFKLAWWDHEVRLFQGQVWRLSKLRERENLQIEKKRIGGVRSRLVFLHPPLSVRRLRRAILPASLVARKERPSPPVTPLAPATLAASLRRA